MRENDSLFDEDGKTSAGMTMNSVDIMQQKFVVRFRGYDVQDVDEFLEVVSNEIEQLVNDNTRMEKDIAVYRKEIDLYKKKEDSINATLVTVQQISEDLKKNSVNEAENIINSSRKESESLLFETRQECDALREDALVQAQKIIDNSNLEAERINGDAVKEKDQIENEINVLKEKKVQFQDTLKNLIETHLKFLENESNND